MTRAALSVLWLVLLASSAAVARAQVRDPHGAETLLTGPAGAAGASVAPLTLRGGALPRDEGPLSGTHRLGTAATSEGALVLMGTFRAGRLVDVAASRGRTRVSDTPTPAELGRALDGWRPSRPAGLPLPGGTRDCGIEATRIAVPAAAARPAAVEPGSYVSVAWVCGLRTDERWLFRVPPAEAPSPAAAPAS